MDLLTACYNMAYEALKECIPTKPKLVLTAADDYYGLTERENGNYTIFLSSFHLYDDSCVLDFDKTIETICHEFAHLRLFHHGDDHDELTELYMKIVRLQMKVWNIDRTMCTRH